MFRRIRQTAFAMASAIGFARTGADEAEQQSMSFKDQFPQSVEAIPGKLRVKIFLHDLKYESEMIPCWSYLTDGLLAQHQKEIIFTLRREKGQKPEDYPREPLELFGAIFHFAEQGNLVDLGGMTRFGEPGFLGDKEIRGLGYIEPEDFLGIDTGDVSPLGAIILKGDEAQIAWDQSLTRIAAMIGMTYRYYPCPPWSDATRKPVISLTKAQDSVLGQITRFVVQASFYEERNHIFLLIRPASQTKFRELFNEVSEDRPIAICTNPDARANACLVWRPGQNQPLAITPSGSDGSRKTGAFLCFLPEQPENEIRTMEDGFFLLLTDKNWQAIRSALASANDLEIPFPGQAGSGISISWQKGKSYTSSATGETFLADSWVTYEPQPQADAPPAKHRDSVKLIHTVFLAPDRVLAARTSAEDLAAYLERIEDALEAFISSQKEKTKRELTVHLDLDVNGHTVVFAANPDFASDQHATLEDILNQVPAPKVSGPVKLEFILLAGTFPPN